MGDFVYINMNERVVMATVSDDRHGRKGGVYGRTQSKIRTILERNEHFGIGDLYFYTYDDIVKSEFYRINESILRHVDAAINGRCYKPYVIQCALEGVNDGDYVIYNDVSPEWWEVGEDFVIGDEYQLDVLKSLCVTNGDILSCKVSWMGFDGVFANHTHEYFTSERCMRYMGMERYRHCLQHASGMMVFRKSERSVNYVNRWLSYNVIDQCASLSDVVTGEDFWGEEANINGKMGHRHDQSISGLLVNELGQRLVDIPDYWSPYPTKAYNFLSFCRTDFGYSFVDSVVEAQSFRYRNVRVGDGYKIIRCVR